MGYFNNGIGAARINDSSPSDYTTYSGNKIETKQNATDNTLTTTSKTIVGAINEVNSKVNNKFIVAQTLPVSDIDEFAIYLIPKSTAQTNNIYDEYVYISTDIPAHWEKIGDTEIDLSGYYTSSQVDTLLSDKQDVTDNSLATTDKTLVGAINEVVSGKADFSDISSSVSFGSDINASGSVKWVVKIGKLVYIYANLQPKENWTTGGNKILLSGLPARADYQESNYIPYIVGAQYFNSITNEIRGSAVNSSNQLQTQNGSNISTTNRIYINGFYRCQ
jgi:hypothetical protein